MEKINKVFSTYEQFVKESVASIFTREDVIKMLDQVKKNLVKEMSSNGEVNLGSVPEVEKYTLDQFAEAISSIASNENIEDIIDCDTDTAEFDLVGNEIRLESVSFRLREGDFLEMVESYLG
jgi:hypothetical protein